MRALSPYQPQHGLMEIGYTDDGGKKDDSMDETPKDNRIEISRERNREHAKKTRLRKKALLETMKERLAEVQSEVRGVTRHMFLKLLFSFFAF